MFHVIGKDAPLLKDCAACCPLLRASRDCMRDGFIHDAKVIENGMRMRDTPDPALIQQLTGLVERHQWAVFGFVRGLLGEEELARDIAQDAFCDAWRALQRAAPPFCAAGDVEAMRRWIFHAAYCRAMSALRRRHVIRWESLDVEPVSALEPTAVQMPFDERVVESEALRAALRALAHEDAACVLLHVVQGFAISEIAAIVGISLDAAKKRVSRAKQRLRVAYFAHNARPQEDL